MNSNVNTERKPLDFPCIPAEYWLEFYDTTELDLFKLNIHRRLVNLQLLLYRKNNLIPNFKSNDDTLLYYNKKYKSSLWANDEVYEEALNALFKSNGWTINDDYSFLRNCDDYKDFSIESCPRNMILQLRYTLYDLGLDDYYYDEIDVEGTDACDTFDCSKTPEENENCTVDHNMLETTISEYLQFVTFESEAAAFIEMNKEHFTIEDRKEWDLVLTETLGTFGSSAAFCSYFTNTCNTSISVTSVGYKFESCDGYGYDEVSLLKYIDPQIFNQLPKLSELQNKLIEKYKLSN